MSYPKLTAKGWGEIPDGYDWFVVNFEGNKYASKTRPDCLPRMKVWAAKEGFIKIGSIGSVCHDWQNSLQRRPQPAERPTTPPTPAKKCVAIETTMEKLAELAIAFGVPVTFEKPGFCADYYSVMVFGFNREPIVHFTCPAPTLPEFNDDGIEFLVRTYEKIKIT